VSLKDDLTAAERALESLDRATDRLRVQIGDTVDIRRVRADLERLHESLELLRLAHRSDPHPTRPDGIVQIPDTPYDPTLWQDVGDEGVGRHPG
jgi:hypothetical protein